LPSLETDSFAQEDSLFAPNEPQNNMMNKTNNRNRESTQGSQRFATVDTARGAAT